MLFIKHLCCYFLLPEFLTALFGYKGHLNRGRKTFINNVFFVGIDLNKPDAHARELHVFTLNGDSFKLTAHSFTALNGDTSLNYGTNAMKSQHKITNNESIRAHYGRNFNKYTLT